MANTKFIFVSGGVISAVGKGITAASISLLLQKRGFKVTPIKCENNLNVDFGTINPIEHGDPFLCFDGLEADQDLGNYERFLNQQLGYSNFMTMGQLYQTVIQNERNMVYDGEDVEPIPHIVNEIIRRIKKTADETDADFCVIELGGTVGEYENNNGLYYEAARLMAMKHQVAHVHVTYVIQPPHIHEPKTKPAQLSLKELMRMGVTPNFLVVRSHNKLDAQREYKFGQKFGIETENIFSAEDLDDIHEVPLHLHKQSFDEKILKHFRYSTNEYQINLFGWESLVTDIKKKKSHISKIAIVGKYFGDGDVQLSDSYHALFHALKQGALPNDTKIEIIAIKSENQNLEKLLKDVDGIVVPIGWGSRGALGKLEAIKFARENKIPFLGLGYGMQLACIEFAKNVLEMENATSEEWNSDVKNSIIHSVEFDPKYQTMKGENRFLRLGTFETLLKQNTLATKIYLNHDKGESLKNGEVRIEERHRHSFEFNNEYRQAFEKAGAIISGTSAEDLFVDVIELPEKDHPFFIATQFHPEYKTYPMNPHPMFVEFIKATIKN